MKGALTFRTPWLAATACALGAVLLGVWEWSQGDPGGLSPPTLAVWLAPPMVFAAVLLQWVRPWVGALITVVGTGLTTDSGVWLPGALVTFFMLGRREPAWRGWVLVACAMVAFALGSGMPANV